MKDPTQEPEARDAGGAPGRRGPGRPPRVLVSVGDLNDPANWDVIVVENDAIDDETALRIAHERTGHGAALPSLDESDVSPVVVDLAEFERPDAFAAMDAFAPITDVPQRRRRRYVADSPDPGADDELLEGIGLPATVFAAPPLVSELIEPPPPVSEPIKTPPPVSEPVAAPEVVSDASEPDITPPDFAELIAAFTPAPEPIESTEAPAVIHDDLAGFPMAPHDVLDETPSEPRPSQELDFATVFGPVGGELPQSELELIGLAPRKPRVKAPARPQPPDDGSDGDVELYDDTGVAYAESDDDDDDFEIYDDTGMALLADGSNGSLGARRQARRERDRRRQKIVLITAAAAVMILVLSTRLLGGADRPQLVPTEDTSTTPSTRRVATTETTEPGTSTTQATEPATTAVGTPSTTLSTQRRTTTTLKKPQTTTTQKPAPTTAPPPPPTTAPTTTQKPTTTTAPPPTTEPPPSTVP